MRTSFVKDLCSPLLLRYFVVSLCLPSVASFLKVVFGWEMLWIVVDFYCKETTGRLPI